MKLKQIEEKFNIILTETKYYEEPYFEIKWEGDWNDADYIRETEIIFESKMDEEIISFFKYYYNGKIEDYSNERSIFRAIRNKLGLNIPRGYDDDIHTLTWDISYSKNRIKYDIEFNPLTVEEDARIKELLEIED